MRLPLPGVLLLAAASSIIPHRARRPDVKCETAENFQGNGVTAYRALKPPLGKKDMDMEINKYLIHPIDERRVPELLDAHYSSPRRRETRVQDIVPVATFAVSYFLDAVQEAIDRAMLVEKDFDIRLTSGWRARKVDIGHHWKRHVEFTSPTDPESGFILQGLLDMEETERPGDDPFAAGWVDKLMSSFKDQETLVETNQTSEDFLPENSNRIDELSVYPFGETEGWDVETKDKVYDRLLKSRSVREVFEYRPQNPYDGKPYELSPSGRTITEPGQAIDVLRVISEFVHAYDMERFANYMHRHSGAVYMTLDPELLSLYEATRGAMRHDGVFPASPFPEMIGEMWRRGACADILQNMDYLTETAESLIGMGHTAADTVYDCNDGRTRAYATTDGETVSLYSKWEDWSTLFKFRDDRIAVYKCDFETGAVSETVIDLCYENGAVTQINEICAYEDITAGVMKRSLFDISSVHSYVVHDRGRQSGTKSPAP
jgi:hypothetical protein